MFSATLLLCLAAAHGIDEAQWLARVDMPSLYHAQMNLVVADADLGVEGYDMGFPHDPREMAQQAAGEAEQLLVLNGDVPLVTAETLARLARAHEEQAADLSFLTAQVDEAGEYGRVQRDSDGRVTGIVEAAELDNATEGPAEINAGQYCFRARWLWPNLAAIPSTGARR
ncbi:MAG: hypothetical protein IIC26_08680 [Chloroflexi bacterium]|nr:hypothetical protein [Chloroflexota bacterium]